MKRITSASAKHDHIGPILGDLSEISAAEMQAVKMDAWALHGKLRECQGPGGAGADTIFIEGRPVAIIGGIKPDKNHLRTWFLASKEFFADKGTIKFSRNLMKMIQASNGNRLIDAGTASQHPKVEKWLRLLGFKKTVDEPPFSIYRYGET